MFLLNKPYPLFYTRTHNLSPMSAGTGTYCAVVYATAHKLFQALSVLKRAQKIQKASQHMGLSQKYETHLARSVFSGIRSWQQV